MRSTPPTRVDQPPIVDRHANRNPPSQIRHATTTRSPIVTHEVASRTLGISTSYIHHFTYYHNQQHIVIKYTSDWTLDQQLKTRFTIYRFYQKRMSTTKSTRSKIDTSKIDASKIRPRQKSTCIKNHTRGSTHDTHDQPRVVDTIANRDPRGTIQKHRHICLIYT